MRHRGYWPGSLRRKREKGMSKQCLPRKFSQRLYEKFLKRYIPNVQFMIVLPRVMLTQYCTFFVQLLKWHYRRQIPA